jgi:hypothetical protein
MCFVDCTRIVIKTILFPLSDYRRRHRDFNEYNCYQTPDRIQKKGYSFKYISN